MINFLYVGVCLKLNYNNSDNPTKINIAYLKCCLSKKVYNDCSWAKKEQILCAKEHFYLLDASKSNMHWPHKLVVDHFSLFSLSNYKIENYCSNTRYTSKITM